MIFRPLWNHCRVNNWTVWYCDIWVGRITPERMASELKFMGPSIHSYDQRSVFLTEIKTIWVFSQSFFKLFYLFFFNILIHTKCFLVFSQFLIVDCTTSGSKSSRLTSRVSVESKWIFNSFWFLFVKTSFKNCSKRVVQEAIVRHLTGRWW